MKIGRKNAHATFQAYGKHQRKGTKMNIKDTTNDGENIPKLKGEGLYGLHSVIQVLESKHRNVHALYARDPMQMQPKTRSDQLLIEEIHTLAKKENIPISFTSKWMLNHITADKPHQGVVLDVDVLSIPDFTPQLAIELTSNVSLSQPYLLALDELHDPQNVGAILRSAHFLGCSGVLFSEKRSAPLSPATSRASVGALEVLAANNKLYKTNNLHESLITSADLGWNILGASSHEKSIDLSSYVAKMKNETKRPPTILVMGNEHRGLQKSIQQCCHHFVRIQGNTFEEKTRVDSLNVSVAAAILMYELSHL